MADTVEKHTSQPRPAPPYPPPPGLLSWYWLLLALGSLSNDDGEGDENGKKGIGLDWQNNNFVRASRFSVHFFAVVARLPRETS